MKVSELVATVEPQFTLAFVQEHTNKVVSYDACREREVTSFSVGNSNDISVYYRN